MKIKVLFIFLIPLQIALATFMGPGFAVGAYTTEITRAPAANNRSFSFVVWGHPRGKESGKSGTCFDEVLERVTELQADMLFITGDMIWGMWGEATDSEVIRADWERFDAELNRLGIPVYRIPGNHDIHDSITRDIYLERYAKPPFAFTHKGSRFIFLDTIGIDDIGNADLEKRNAAGSLPLGDEQMKFLQDEIGRQSEYDHVFILMHNPEPWARESGFWWKDVHPMLAGGKTRAVIAGSPWYFKYAYVKKDGIPYILSSCVNPPPVGYLRSNPSPTLWAMYKQPDNIQYVKVEKGNFSIRTIAIGTLSSETLNWRYWNQLDEKPPHWTRYLGARMRKMIFRFRNMVILAGIWGAVWLLMGIVITALWMRKRPKR